MKWNISFFSWCGSLSFITTKYCKVFYLLVYHVSVTFPKLQQETMKWICATAIESVLVMKTSEFLITGGFSLRFLVSFRSGKWLERYNTAAMYFTKIMLGGTEKISLGGAVEGTSAWVHYEGKVVSKGSAANNRKGFVRVKFEAMVF